MRRSRSATRAGAGSASVCGVDEAPARVGSAFAATARWRARRLRRDYARLAPDCPPQARELLLSCWELARTACAFEIATDGAISLHPEGADVHRMVAAMDAVRVRAYRAYAARFTRLVRPSVTIKGHTAELARAVALPDESSI